MKVVLAGIVGLLIGLAGGFFFSQSCPLLSSNSIKSELSTESIAQKARPIIDNIVSAIGEKNYEKFMRDFQPEMRNLLPEEQFKRVALMIENPLGGISGTTYLGSYQKGNTTVTLWRARAKNTGDDEMMTMSLIENEGVYRVVGFFIQ